MPQADVENQQIIMECAHTTYRFCINFVSLCQAYIQDQRETCTHHSNILGTFLSFYKLLTMPQGNIEDQQIIMEYGHTTY